MSFMCSTLKWKFVLKLSTRWMASCIINHLLFAPFPSSWVLGLCVCVHLCMSLQLHRIVPFFLAHLCEQFNLTRTGNKQILYKGKYLVDQVQNKKTNPLPLNADVCEEWEWKWNLWKMKSKCVTAENSIVCWVNVLFEKLGQSSLNSYARNSVSFARRGDEISFRLVKWEWLLASAELVKLLNYLCTKCRNFN